MLGRDTGPRYVRVRVGQQAAARWVPIEPTSLTPPLRIGGHGVRTYLVALLWAIAVIGCGSDPMPTVSPSNGPDPATLRYSCAGGTGFLPSLLDQRGTAELENHPSAEELRTVLIGDSMGLGYLPDLGWWLVSRDEKEVHYITRLPQGLESPFGFVSLQARGGEWAFASGGSCLPEVVLEGRVPAGWTLPSNQPALHPGRIEFTALVTDRICTAGQPVGERLLPPLVTYTESSVYVVFSARPYQGLTTCEGKPPTETMVRLREPLGNRNLLDAGVFPAADPRTP